MATTDSEADTAFFQSNLKLSGQEDTWNSVQLCPSPSGDARPSYFLDRSAHLFGKRSMWTGSSSLGLFLGESVWESACLSDLYPKASTTLEDKCFTLLSCPGILLYSHLTHSPWSVVWVHNGRRCLNCWGPVLACDSLKFILGVSDLSQLNDWLLYLKGIYV